MQLVLRRSLAINAALSCLAFAAVLAACGDDPKPTPTATFLLSQAPPSSFNDYTRLAEEDPAGRDSMFEEAIAMLSRDIEIDSTNVDSYVKRGAVYTTMYAYSGMPSDRDEGSFELAPLTSIQRTSRPTSVEAMLMNLGKSVKRPTRTTKRR